MPNYRRLPAHGGTFFFTVVIADRRRALLTDNVDLLRSAFLRTRRDLPFAIDACVILPDHVHCIWTLPAGDCDFAQRWRLLKSSFSRGLSERETLSASRARRHERGIWQRRFWEHAIRNERDYAAHFDYIHYNPVKHGHVQRTADWPYSTFHRYVRSGVYPVGWASSTDSSGGFGE
jgi:putative transposase